MTRVQRVIHEMKHLRKVGLPIIIAQLLLMSINVVDTIMAGNYSSTALAAVAVGTSSMLPLYIFMMGVLMAVTPMVAQHVGARNLSAIGQDVRQSILLGQLMALPLFFVMRYLSLVMPVFDIEAEIIPIADAYLDAYSWGVFPVFAYLSLRFFNEGLGNTLPAMWIAAIGLIANIPANYVLIYGKFGLPALGAEGCGWASSLVGLVLFLSMYVYNKRNKAFARFELFTLRLYRWNTKVQRELVRLGSPIGVTSTMEVTAFAFVSLVMARLGTEIVAAHQIAINIAAVVYMIPFGLSMAITTRVGKAIGAKNPVEARFRGKVGILLSLAIMVFTASFLYLGRHALVGIYTDDPQVYDIAVSLLLLAAIFQLSDGLQVAGYGALKGLKDTRVPMVVNLIAYWVIGIPIGYYLGLHTSMGPAGLWVGFICGLSVAAVLHNLRFNYKTRKLMASITE